MLPRHVQQQSVLISLRDVRLEGFLTLPSKLHGLVIFAHGSGSGRLSPRNNYVAQILRANGLGTLLFDLLTEEEDQVYENRFDINLLAQRLREATEWAMSEPWSKDLGIGYFGASTGAAAALKAAAVLGPKIGAIVSRGGRPDLAEDSLGRIESPTLFIVGGEDHEVLELNQKALDEVNTEKQLIVIPNTTHLFPEPGALRQVAELSACWFKNHLGNGHDRCSLRGQIKSRWKSIEFALMGNIMLGRKVDRKLQERSAVYPWGDVLPVIGESDVRFCNLECVLSDIGRPVLGITHPLRGQKRDIDVLKVAGIDIVSLANNHVLDFGEAAFCDMLGTLRQAHIAYAGAGANSYEANDIWKVDVRGSRIGLIALTDLEPSWAAGPDRPGVQYVPINPSETRARELFKRISDAKQSVDTLIASIHWGSNWEYKVPDEHRSFAHALVDAGADIIAGHSSHVFRGVEIYKGCPIFYSLGNFINDFIVRQPEPNDESFIFICDIGNHEMQKIYCYPVVIKNMQAELASSGRGRAIAKKMIALCGNLGTEAKWNRECRYLEIGTGYSIEDKDTIGRTLAYD